MDKFLIIQINHGQCSHNSNQSWTLFLLLKSNMDYAHISVPQVSVSFRFCDSMLQLKIA